MGDNQLDLSSVDFARVLDGAGGGRQIAADEIEHWSPASDKETLWVHLDRTCCDLRGWLESALPTSSTTAELLTSNDNRPRAFIEGEALVSVLRGINFNPGAEPEDMVSLHIWASQDRVITIRRRPLQTPRDILQRVDEASGPKTAGGLVTDLVEQLISKMSLTIIDMNEHIDLLEDKPDDLSIEEKLDQIAAIRRNCLALKRHMSPQHEALTQLHRDPPHFFSKSDKRDVMEASDRLRRYLEDLDVSKESAIVLQDDLNNHAAAESNRTMYMLSIVAAIFLPLSFITGLLGINVGGMPGVDDSNAFWITIGSLVIVFALQIYIFRKLKWL